MDRIALALRNAHRHHFILETAFLPRGRAALVALDRKGILVLTAEAAFLRAQLGAVAHVVAVVHIGKAVLHHAVDQLHIAQLLAGAACCHVKRHLAHVLHAAGHHHIIVAGHYRLGTQHDRFHAARAHLVHRGTRHVMAKARVDRRLPCGRLAHVGLQHATHEHFIHMFRINTAPAEGFLDHRGAQLCGSNG